MLSPLLQALGAYDGSVATGASPSDGADPTTGSSAETVFLVDVDFAPSAGLRAALSSTAARASVLGRGESLVVPAFELAAPSPSEAKHGAGPAAAVADLRALRAAWDAGEAEGTSTARLFVSFVVPTWSV